MCLVVGEWVLGCTLLLVSDTWKLHSLVSIDILEVLPSFLAQFPALIQMSMYFCCVVQDFLPHQ